MDLNKISSFRSKLNDTLADVNHNILGEVDPKDIKRLKSDDKYVMCFLLWRKGDVDAAVKMAVDVLKWRKERDINNLKVEDIDLDLMKRGIIFVHGKALDGTRVVYFLGRHQTKDIKTDVQKILCLWLERLQCQETGQHVTFVLDVSKTSMSNVDLGGIRFLMDCFITYFPNMLERMVIVEMPWIMNAIWKVVKQWMTEEQRKRTAFVNFKDVHQFIAPDNILKYMGGEDEWTYQFPLPPDHIPSLTHITNYDSSHEETESVPEAQEDGEQEECVVDDVQVTVTEISNLPSDHSLLNDGTHEDKFQSVNLTAAGGDMKSKRSSVTGRTSNIVPFPGVNLNSLLIMSPISELIFDEAHKDVKSGRYQAYIKLNNPSEESVAFKIKTNAPDRYHVKPSSGCVEPGQTVDIRINLIPGNEQLLYKDRFLVLYQVKTDDSDLNEFWRIHLPKGNRHEHRVRVKFSAVSVMVHEGPNLSAMKDPSLSSVTDDSSRDEVLEKMRSDVLGLKKEVSHLRKNTVQLQFRLHISIAINCIVLLLFIYFIRQLSLLMEAYRLDHF